MSIALILTPALISDQSTKGQCTSSKYVGRGVRNTQKFANLPVQSRAWVGVISAGDSWPLPNPMPSKILILIYAPEVDGAQSSEGSCEFAPLQ
jgi:hypothetical protein